MIMATYNDFFNTDNNIKSATKFNKESKVLKEQILKSVKSVIKEEKKQYSNEKNN